jgi:hypothetical protein
VIVESLVSRPFGALELIPFDVPLVSVIGATEVITSATAIELKKITMQKYASFCADGSNCFITLALKNFSRKLSAESTYDLIGPLAIELIFITDFDMQLVMVYT